MRTLVCHSYVQDRTDAKLAAIAPASYVAFEAPNDPDCPEGFYIAQAQGASYLLNSDTTLHELKGRDGKPLEMPKGSSIVDAVYLNPVRGIQGARGWYLPYPKSDARRKVRVPSHLILHAGFNMPPAVAPPAPAPPAVGKKGAKKPRWGPADAKREAVSKGAVVLELAVHGAINDELDLRQP